MKILANEMILPIREGWQCHASHILPLPGDEVFSVFFYGTQEGSSDVRIYGSLRSSDGRWSEAVPLSEDDGVPNWNPVLFRLKDGCIALYYKLGKPPIANWKTMVMYSRDEGVSWSEPAELVQGDDSGGRGPVKNKAIYLSDGALLAPASVERGPWRAFIDYSTDDGMTWEKKPIPVAEGEEINMIQPTLWESSPGHVHALMRTSRGFIYRSDSADGGKSWSVARATEVPNNHSGIDCARLADGTLVLVCNPNGKDWGPRTPLTVFVSTDNGAHFEKALDLETAEGEYSYPAVIAQGDKVLVTYTWKRKTVAFCVLEYTAEK